MSTLIRGWLRAQAGPSSSAKVEFNWNVKLYSVLFKAPIQNGVPCYRAKANVTSRLATVPPASVPQCNLSSSISAMLCLKKKKVFTILTLRQMNIYYLLLTI